MRESRKKDRKEKELKNGGNSVFILRFSRSKFAASFFRWKLNRIKCQKCPGSRTVLIGIGPHLLCYYLCTLRVITLTIKGSDTVPEELLNRNNSLSYLLLCKKKKENCKNSSPNRIIFWRIAIVILTCEGTTILRIGCQDKKKKDLRVTEQENRQ